MRALLACAVAVTMLVGTAAAASAVNEVPNATGRTLSVPQQIDRSVVSTVPSSLAPAAWNGAAPTPGLTLAYGGDQIYLSVPDPTACGNPTGQCIAAMYANIGGQTINCNDVVACWSVDWNYASYSGGYPIDLASVSSAVATYAAYAGTTPTSSDTFWVQLYYWDDNNADPVVPLGVSNALNFPPGTGATVTVTDNSQSIAAGGSLVFTASVSGADATPTGTVQWSLTGPGSPSCVDSTLVGGRATCSIANAAAGAYTAQADYGGDGTYGAATGSDTTAVVRATLTAASLTGGESGDVLSTTCSCSDPVNTDTGEFWHTFDDLSVPGRGMALDATRTYSSQLASTLGPMGYGWTHSYAPSLSFDGAGNAIVHQETGSTITAQHAGSSYTFPSFVLATLTKNTTNGTFTLTHGDGTRQVFSAAGRLTQEIDRNGYVTALAYTSGGQLKSVTDPASRAFKYAFGANGLVGSVADPMGRKVSFAYDTAKNLTSTTDAAGAKWSFTYDTNHRMLSMTNPRGGTTTNVYDSSGRVTSQKDPMGRTSTYAYAGSAGAFTTTLTNPRKIKTRFVYAGNKLVSQTSAYGTADASTRTYTYDPTVYGATTVTAPNGVTTYSYDSRGNVLSETDPLGRTTTTTYNGFNEPLTVTDPMGVIITYTYDTRGNLRSQQAASSTNTFTYGDSAHPGDVTAQSDPDHRVTSFAYDAAGDRTSVTDPDGHTALATYDQDGHRLSARTPNGHLTAFTYDAVGRLLSTTDALGHATTNIYDGNGNRTATTDPLGHTTKYTYDLDDELVTTLRGDGTTTTNTYDGNGNRTTTVDGAGHTNKWAYDPLDHVTSQTDALGRTTTYSYDAVGNRTGRTDAAGNATSYTYDAANQRTGVAYSGGTTTSLQFTYDKDGRRVSMTDATGTTTYSYDSLGRQTSSTTGAGQTVKHAYDAAGQVTKLTYPNGKAVTYTYDGRGDLTGLTDWLGHHSTFAYDGDANLTSEVAGSTTPVTDAFTYDAIGEPTSLATTARGAPASLQYTRNADSLVASATPAGKAAQPFGYDAMNRLLTDASGSYSYTAGGDLASTPAASSMIYDAADELTTSAKNGSTTSYTYDQRGNRVRTGIATTYGYDAEGHLTTYQLGTTQASYVYDATGLRMTQVVNGTTTHFAWDTTPQNPLMLSDGKAMYVYGPGGLPVERIAATRAAFYHHDQLGSTTMLTDDTGTAIATYTYTSFGNQLTATGTVANPLRHAGQYLDSTTGLYYLRARWYDPATSQFMSVDPAVTATGQRYAYADNSPVNASDPTGLGAIARGYNWAKQQAGDWAKEQAIDEGGGMILPPTLDFLAGQGPSPELFAGAARGALAADDIGSALGEVWAGEVLAPLAAWDLRQESQLNTALGGSARTSDGLDELANFTETRAADWLLTTGYEDLQNGITEAGQAGNELSDAMWNLWFSDSSSTPNPDPGAGVCHMTGAGGV